MTKKPTEVFICFNGRLWRASGTITTREEYREEFGRVIPKGCFLTQRRLSCVPRGFTDYRKTLKGGLSLFRKIYGRENRHEVRHF